MTFALVMAGGGARGAYEAGVLRFVLSKLPQRLGRPIGPDIICGTSVGALNGAYIGAAPGDPSAPMRLSGMWREMDIKQVYRFEALDLLRSPFRIFGTGGQEHRSLVDGAPLHQYVRDSFPWEGLRRAIDQGRLRAFVVAATDIASGRCVQFVDQAPDNPKIGSHHAEVSVVHTRITAEHCLASSAIPFLFPAIAVDGQMMADGSLRQNTPLSPALRFGAKKVLVVGVKRAMKDRTHTPYPDQDPTMAFLAGKALNALMLDPIEKDLRRLEVLNTILNWGTQTYGDDFLTQLNEVVTPIRGAGYHSVETVFIRPSTDIGAIAAEAWRAQKSKAPRATRMLLETIAAREAPSEADLLSYLLFDRSFTAELETLGYHDAQAREDELVAFFAPDSPL